MFKERLNQSVDKHAIHLRSVRGLDPYSSFRNDRERRKALRARDIRMVCIALILGLTANTQSVQFLAWLRSFLQHFV
ncbi:hypothetical protein FSC37_13340 [Piscinibacter aquaticus]|uniref:Uncharacterized protein n=1 Tax=Piscinibacter aquaticus TaxID=392597 RepID=A0A5C6U139_9BURK|nr:hypothetical protein FSC37_13340 [Piscinibacter aquaticus]